MLFLFLFVIFGSCQGFLLDGNTQTATSGGTSLDDKRFNTLMDLLIEERDSRSKLEAAVKRELLALKQEITKCQCGNGNGGHTQIIDQGSLANDTKTLEEEIIHLKRDQELLKTEVAGLIQNNTVLKDKIELLEQNLTTMENTKSDLNFRNETNRLEKALQMTNNKLNAVTNDVDARKQDFIALFQRVQSTDQRLENSTKSLEASQNTSFVELQKEILREAKLVEQNISDRTKLLEMQENSTSLKLQEQTVLLQQELNKMSNRVALTTCKNANDTIGGVMQFTVVKTVNGIHNTDSIRNTGIFTCENPGLYLISVYIQTNTKVGVYYVNKNTNHIADGFSSPIGYQTTSVTVIQRLSVNDTISVTGNMHAFNGVESCLTILQIL